MRRVSILWPLVKRAPQAPPPRRSAIAQQDLDAYRKDARELTDAITGLSERLDATVTRDEVSQELNERLRLLESAHASALNGTKNQLRRTRRAGAFLWALILALSSFTTIQIHDLHIDDCMLATDVGATRSFMCHAIFPFSDHENQKRLQQAIAEPGAGEHDQSHETVAQHDYPVSPRLVGMTGYSILFLGVGLLALRYRRLSREEHGIEVGEFTTEDLDTLASAQGDEATPPFQQSREDTEQ